MSQQPARRMLARKMAPTSMSKILEVPVRPDQPGRSSLENVINAQLSIEKWERRTRQWHQLVVAVSIPMAYKLFAGGKPLGAHIILSFWLLTFVSSFVCAQAAWRAHNRLERLLRTSGGGPRILSDGGSI